jgi:hypothetical protein
MTSWTEIFPDVDGSPVRGERYEFRNTRDFFQRFETSASEIARQFDRFRDHGQASGSLEGDAAAAFARFVDQVGGELDEVPRIAGQAVEIFDHHHRELDRLMEWAEEGADSALARARTAWRAREDLEERASRLSAQVRQLEGDVRSAENAAAADPAGDTSEADQLGDQLSGAQHQLGGVQDDLDHQNAVLDGIRAEWSEIRDEEHALNRRTVDELDGIDLGELENPGFWDRVGDAVGALVEFVIEIADIMLGPLDEILGALLSGDWAQLLWELKELLDVVLVVLAVVALLVPFCAPLVIAVFALSVLALAVNAALYHTQWPNPETGETVGLGDVLWSATGVLFSAAGGLKALSALRAVRAGTATRLANGNIIQGGKVVFRQETSLANLVRQGRGLVPQRFPLGTRTTSLTPFQVLKFGNDGYRRLYRNPTTMAGFGAEDYADALDMDRPGPSTQAIQDSAHRLRFDSSPWTSPPWNQQQLILRTA